ncbi:hypothetical protein DSL72_001352 [Monilinia vaccinii-corymbosi]|uniref:Uncharacterized protein n=1 Tax=Monilinia vaccinii-corymbosi TaxID=61207 RepID=A0A8A3P1S6_9HELO|nr:hypothetical protein DSL72_001352 [Monilinia vaccinii-corymbosi]
MVYRQPNDGVFRERTEESHGKAERDEIRLRVDALEELTHSTCRLFKRAIKAISLCPPVYYADLLCSSMKAYLADHDAPTGHTTPEPGAEPAWLR